VGEDTLELGDLGLLVGVSGLLGVCGFIEWFELDVGLQRHGQLVVVGLKDA
jgi:hypothetical protein